MSLVVALAACATPAPPPPVEPVVIAAPLPVIQFPPPPQKIVLVDPFQGAGADLEPLPPSTGDLWDRIVQGYAIPDMEGPLVEKWEQWYSDRPDYVARVPVAVVEQRGQIVAFASVWPGPHQVELSIDLMRYRREAPNGVMEGLMVYLMRWGKEQGYHSFSLGMAPLSGFERSPIAPLWNRLGSFLYAHGETFYNFRGLRAYKDKFHPSWEPRDLAYPGGLTLPRTLADVAALIAGGYRRILIRGTDVRHERTHAAASLVRA